jgi:hypothetical protein
MKREHNNQALKRHVEKFVRTYTCEAVRNQNFLLRTARSYSLRRRSFYGSTNTRNNRRNSDANPCVAQHFSIEIVCVREKESVQIAWYIILSTVSCNNFKNQINTSSLQSRIFAVYFISVYCSRWHSAKKESCSSVTSRFVVTGMANKGQG